MSLLPSPSHSRRPGLVASFATFATFATFAGLVAITGAVVAPLSAQNPAPPQRGAPPAGPSDNLPRFTPDGKHIVFQTTRDGGAPQSHVINLDGGDEHALSGPAGAVSPDGKRVLFTKRGPMPSSPGVLPKISLMSANVDGTDEREISALPLSQDGVWSRDGRQIMFAALAGPVQPGSRPEIAIFLADADGSNRRRLFPADAHPYQIQARWSPDNRKIVYAVADTGRQLRLMIANADGSAARAIGIVGDNPQWSPDGKQLAYWAVRGGNADVYVSRADGTNERRLTDGPARDEAPAWSPDGKLIAFQSDRDGPMTIYVMNADGTHARKLRP